MASLLSELKIGTHTPQLQGSVEETVAEVIELLAPNAYPSQRRSIFNGTHSESHKRIIPDAQRIDLWTLLQTEHPALLCEAPLTNLDGAQFAQSH